ncbi:TIGR03960 family B12-binding radical SAM protein [Thermosediminibacter oceani]|uniref:Radical SAM domain protein n=1 Tax=Thermosediminibacter oceani (strain ATCC BAA-1034 / DSM 16646 / JW/IW-1228P) TaxID=555079 RepID=D9S289_THEOJ|nr:TIGR03960 family B12-binding radical SAM protein [Thermosediminibacter oceani]ADL07516.1 Radical SAM domain protein [Thermosediminibacter oceani DSM 16646]
MEIKQILDEVLPQVSKPTRYTGNELNSVQKDKSKVKVRIALAFPDVYEVGMSHLGLRILYHLLNEREDVYAERVFAPWVDFEEIMRERGIPLFSLESKSPLSEFDFVGFSLQYEMSYSNVTNMLDLAGIPLFSKDRTDRDPIVIAGGPCAYNPEPLAEIIDLFVIGEAEEVILELVNLYLDHKKSSKGRIEFLERAARIPGVYVPAFYRVNYNEDGTVKEILPVKPGIPERVQKRIIRDLDRVYYPTKLIVPYMDIVHDRAVLEIFRGCTRGCRFCQAGMIYRPVREKSVDKLTNIAREMIKSTGYEEISLASLSTSDYSALKQLVEILTDEFRQCMVGLSLPSLRIDSFTLDLARKIQEIKKSGLTFAPEAGTQRLRDVINKGVTEEDLLNSVKGAFEAGWNTVKLYFMIGLPSETYEDLEGIARLAYRVVDAYREVRGNTKGLKVTVSTSTFVPKPFTPFQWEAQIPLDEIKERQRFLKKKLKGPNISYNWHDGKLSFLEAVFSRGDRKLNSVLKKARERGCRFDGWSDMFSFDKWMEAFREAGVNPEFYANRSRPEDEVFPWEVIDPGVEKSFLITELKKAREAKPTPDCRFNRCHGCGIMKLKGGIICDSKNED